jgi:hypothetical protein
MKPITFSSLAVAILFLLSRPATGAETNHNFAKWEKDIAAFEKSDLTNPPPADAVEFIGSSTIARWKTLAQDFAGVFPYAPRMIVLRAGGNDLWAGKTPEQVFADFKEFTAVVHAKLPETEIVFLSLSPSLARWKQHEQEKEVNRLAEDFARRAPHVKYLETYDLPLGADGQPRAELFVADKLHFNADGYKLLAERVRPIFLK